VVKGESRRRGWCVLEAPRGTLIHHYRLNANDQVMRANLIVSTTHNNQALNQAIRQVAKRYLDGRTITEGLLNHIEVAIAPSTPASPARRTRWDRCRSRSNSSMPPEHGSTALRRDGDGGVDRPPS